MNVHQGGVSAQKASKCLNFHRIKVHRSGIANANFRGSYYGKPLMLWSSPISQL